MLSWYEQGDEDQILLWYMYCSANLFLSVENVLFSNCRNCAPFSRSVLYRIFVDVVSIVLIHFVTLLQEILHALARYMFSFHKEVSTCTIPFFARFLSFCSNWIVNAFWTYTFIPDALLLMHWHFLFCLEPPFRFYFWNFVFSHQPALVVSECILWL